MARRTHRFPDNRDGAFYVEVACIDCDRCRQTAPEHFARNDVGFSYVVKQPEGAEAIARCQKALGGCPVGAIGADGDAAQAPPMVKLLPDLYACGHPSAATDEAEAYLIVRPGGNVLVDVPAFDPALVAQLEGLGDLRYIFLTHEDTLGEVEAFQLHFGAEVIMHASEADQVYLGAAHPFEESHQLFPDLEVLHTPGHTPGSSCLLWRRHGGCLFVGDHLLPCGEDLAPVAYEWTHDWERQLAEAARLLDQPWHHAFPARGARELPKGFLPKAKPALMRGLERCQTDMKKPPAA